MARRRLENRRPNETFSVEHANVQYSATVGFCEGGLPCEVFCRAEKPDSDADNLADEVAIALSLALQNGVTPKELGHSLGRGDGKPASLVGVLVGLLEAAKHEA